MTFADLIEAVRRNKVRTNSGPLNFTPQQFSWLASLQHYDFGGMFVKRHVEDIGLPLFTEYLREVMIDVNAGNPPVQTDDVSIGFLWVINGCEIPHIVPTPGRAAIEAMQSGQTVVAFAFYSGGWHLETIDCEDTCLVATRLIEDAELNVEFVERPDPRLDSVNRGRANANLPAIPRTRVISLSKTRKAYLGNAEAQPHQGGTHARPREHRRILTERFIQPKNRRGYWRKEKVVIVNAGVAPAVVTRVVQ